MFCFDSIIWILTVCIFLFFCPKLKAKPFQSPYCTNNESLKISEMGLGETWNFFPRPCNSSPLNGIKRFKIWDRNCLVATPQCPLALNARAVRMPCWLGSWCGCCHVRGMSPRAAIPTSANAEGKKFTLKTTLGSPRESRFHPKSFINQPAAKFGVNFAQPRAAVANGEEMQHWLDAELPSPLHSQEEC